jgi:hypothetical protein
MITIILNGVIIASLLRDARAESLPGSGRIDRRQPGCFVRRQAGKPIFNPASRWAIKNLLNGLNPAIFSRHTAVAKSKAYILTNHSTTKKIMDTDQALKVLIQLGLTGEENIDKVRAALDSVKDKATDLTKEFDPTKISAYFKQIEDGANQAKQAIEATLGTTKARDTAAQATNKSAEALALERAQNNPFLTSAQKTADGAAIRANYAEKNAAAKKDANDAEVKAARAERNLAQSELNSLVQKQHTDGAVSPTTRAQMERGIEEQKKLHEAIAAQCAKVEAANARLDEITKIAGIKNAAIDATTGTDAQTSGEKAAAAELAADRGIAGQIAGGKNVSQADQQRVIAVASTIAGRQLNITDAVTVIETGAQSMGAYTEQLIRVGKAMSGFASGSDLQTRLADMERQLTSLSGRIDGLGQ